MLYQKKPSIYCGILRNLLTYIKKIRHYFRFVHEGGVQQNKFAYYQKCAYKELM